MVDWKQKIDYQKMYETTNYVVTVPSTNLHTTVAVTPDNSNKQYSPPIYTLHYEIVSVVALRYW